MRDYLKNNDICKEVPIPCDMMSVILEGALDEELMKNGQWYDYR